ncbi:MAG TPA: hypothetical protein VMJ75_00745 [Candidatus Acidoferrales bacterium]|nr:hypothetical protein [Candidatus Acidoferrales bacterium]
MSVARLLTALVVCSGSLCADTIIVTGLDTPLGEQSTLWINEKGTNTQLYWAGGINAKVDNTYTRTMWCVQLFVDISVNTTYNTTIDWADTPQLERVAWMIQNIAPGLTTQTQGAAFQLAIWDIIEDNGDGFAVGAGNVYKSTSSQNPTDSTVLTLATQYETQSVGQAFMYEPVYHNVTVGNGTPVQNLIGPVPYDGGPLGNAPEPADVGLVLSGLGLIAIGGWQRKKRAG